MSEVMSAAEIEAKAKAAGLSINDLCLGAGIALSTFYRWRKGDTEPTLGVYQRLCDVAQNGVPAKEAAAPAQSAV